MIDGRGQPDAGEDLAEGARSGGALEGMERGEDGRAGIVRGGQLREGIDDLWDERQGDGGAGLAGDKAERGALEIELVPAQLGEVVEALAGEEAHEEEGAPFPGEGREEKLDLGRGELSADGGLALCRGYGRGGVVRHELVPDGGLEGHANDLELAVGCARRGEGGEVVAELLDVARRDGIERGKAGRLEPGPGILGGGEVGRGRGRLDLRSAGLRPIEDPGGGIGSRVPDHLLSDPGKRGSELVRSLDVSTCRVLRLLSRSFGFSLILETGGELTLFPTWKGDARPPEAGLGFATDGGHVRSGNA